MFNYLFSTVNNVLPSTVKCIARSERGLFTIVYS